MANSNFLAMCINLTNIVLEAKNTVYINVRIGSNFNFTFNNQERNPLPWKKRKSPSQSRRDELRLSQFQKKKSDEAKDASKNEANLEVPSMFHNFHKQRGFDTIVN